MKNQVDIEFAREKKQLNRARKRIGDKTGVCWEGLSIRQLREYQPEDEYESHVINVRLARHAEKVEAMKKATKRKQSTPEPMQKIEPRLAVRSKSPRGSLDSSKDSETSAGGAFHGSNAARTRSFLARLSRCGDAGKLAAALFRAQKSSSRAKDYKGDYKSFSYDRKEESLKEICVLLSQATNPVPWGWAIDENGYYRNVLYIDLPVGQVSFHSTERFEGPDYPGKWDFTQCSKDNVLAYCESIIESVPPEVREKARKEPKPRKAFQCFVCQLEKLATQRKPNGWKWLFLPEKQSHLLCSDTCREEFLKNAGTEIYHPSWIFPRGKMEGQQLQEADEDYLQYLSKNLDFYENDLCQAASVELTRRAIASAKLAD